MGADAEKSIEHFEAKLGQCAPHGLSPWSLPRGCRQCRGPRNMRCWRRLCDTAGGDAPHVGGSQPLRGRPRGQSQVSGGEQGYDLLELTLLVGIPVTLRLRDLRDIIVVKVIRDLDHSKHQSTDYQTAKGIVNVAT